MTENGLSDEEIHLVETEVKYEGYISRQRVEIARFKKTEKKRIPATINYHQVRGISKEATEKLSKVRPASIGQASRIPGISPCDLSLLAVYLERAKVPVLP